MSGMVGSHRYKTTANVYGHLDMSRKNAIAEGMVSAISKC